MVDIYLFRYKVDKKIRNHCHCAHCIAKSYPSLSLSSELQLLLLDYVNCTLGPTECMAAARRLVPG